MIALLIVGPKKNHSNVLRETDGERFFGQNTEAIFSNNSNDHLLAFSFRRRSFSQVAILDPITYPHAVELFASGELKKRIRDRAHIFRD